MAATLLPPIPCVNKLAELNPKTALHQTADVGCLGGLLVSHHLH